MIKLIFTLTFLCLYLISTGAVQECGPNEEYTCKDPNCISTCQNAFGICNQTAKCVNGCYCKDGLIRDTKSKKCVILSECPNCSDGKVYGLGNECSNQCVRQICTQNIGLGCFCPTGQCELNGVCVSKDTSTTKIETTTTTCPSGKILRSSNSCFDKCGSKACPKYIKYDCFCPIGQCDLDGVCVFKDGSNTSSIKVEARATTCPPGKTLRYTNSCFDRCDSVLCPQYIIYGCFCPADQCNRNGTCVARTHN